MKIIFTGDICFRDLSFDDAQKCKSALEDVLPRFKNSDFIIANLETPMADPGKHKPIKKSGPNIISLPHNITFLKILGVDAVTLANNHIGDFGENAVEETLNLLELNKIGFCGAGANINKAYDALHLEKDGVSVSIISVCENEFGIATQDKYGSAGYNARMLFNRIKTERLTADKIIIVFHGGNEYNPLPSPDTVDRYRLICDMGADAVIAGHTHCVQGYELYNRKPILYSLGNFFFKSAKEREKTDSWYYGYAVETDISSSGITFDIIPYYFDPEVTKISVFKEKKKEKMLAYIESLSEIIRNPDLLEKYFCGWTYRHKWFPTVPKDYSKLDEYESSGNFNLISCEAHLSQAKKLLELCFNNRMEEACKWAEIGKGLEKMPI